MLFESIANNLGYLGCRVVEAVYDLNYKAKLAESDHRYKTRVNKEKDAVEKINGILGECGWDFKGANPLWLSFGTSDNSSVIKNAWMNDLEFLSAFISDCFTIDARNGDMSEIDKNRVTKFLDIISDPESQDNIINFDRRHSEETSMLQLIVTTSGILYKRYPNYEDIYMDKEKELSEYNRRHSDKRKIMVSLPKTIDNIFDVNIGMPLMTRPRKDEEENIQEPTAETPVNMDSPLLMADGSTVKPGQNVGAPIGI